MNGNPRFWAVVPAAGRGNRMESVIPKQYLPLMDRPVLSHTLGVLLACRELEAIVLALHAEDSDWPGLPESKDDRIKTTTGGASRAQSVLNALEELSNRADEEDFVLVHDAARPCLRQCDLNLLMRSVRHADGALLAAPVHDTIKRSDCRKRVLQTVNRQDLWHALTPQCFRLGLLRAAIEDGLRKGLAITDEACAMEYQGYQPLLIEGRSDNIKITRPADLKLAELYLSLQSGE